MTRRHTIIWTAAALAALLAGVLGGCTTASKPRAKRATQSAPYDFQKEGTIPPETRKVEEAADVEEMPVVDEPLEVEEADAPPDSARFTPPPQTGPRMELVDGFRVQVFASQSKDVAEAARRTAQARLGIAAYSELSDGLYKVRVGDSLTREQAEKVLATCRAVYYKDAWIVETQVNVPANQ